jgi:acetoin utilization deacetylase AcuC-like enzyme
VREVPFDEIGAWQDIATVHAPEYVEAVRTGDPRTLAESRGFRWSPGFAESVARIWAGHTAACRLALHERLVLHPVSGAHHAHRARGAGFCTFNWLVGAGRALLREGAVQRVAIIDLDAHQGDGTLALAGEDPRFALFDISGWSWIGRFDTGRNIYRVARDAAEYLRHLRHLGAWLARLQPDLVQYQAGMDCFEKDPLGGIEGVTEEFLALRDRLVTGEIAARGIPLVINLAGGYLEDGTTQRLHVNTVRIAGEHLGGPHRA